MASPRFQSGNQFGRGRPKGSSYVQRCRDWADQRGWDQLEQWADGKDRVPKKLQFQAMRLLLAYGFGRPAEAIEVSSGMPTTLFEWLAYEHKRKAELGGSNTGAQ